MHWIYLKLLPFLMSSCIYTVAHTPSTYQIVYTSQITSQEQQFISNKSRKRRAADKSEIIYLNITGDSVQFNLRLKANTGLLAPGFKVYIRHHDNTTDTIQTDSNEPIESDCIFTGDVTSHENSKAAISLCRGVTGVLRLPTEDYVIEPLPKHLDIQSQNDDILDNQQPHILYKKTDLPHQEFRQQKTIERDYSKTVQNAQTTPDNRSELRSHQHHYSATNLKQTVETLVVADKTMVQRHGRHNITTYILSILNIVSKLFEDNSLGKPVEILLVGLVVLETDEPGLHISHHADYTLNSFCQWQSTLSDSTGRRHDHAILLTGLDICSNKNAPCDTLGFAPINGMCNPLRSCIMNEDTGLATAFTVTHEIGHNFGMFHDGEGNNCKRGAGNIMSPTLTGRNGLFQWSSCSRNYFLKFLNTIQSNCLSDRPTYIQEFEFPDKLPGELYDATTQCKWLFGATAKVCSYEFGKLQVCKSLWCYKGNKMCETKFLPAAEGTKCGVGMWCRHSKCEKKPLQKPKEINGGWSPWTPWTRCSRTCGGGIQQRNRKCNNPKPKYNGKPCIGELVMFSLCNTQVCTGSTDFRSEQCQEFDKKSFRGWFYNWTAYRKIQRDEDQCKLYCQAKDYNFFFALSNKVKDGTLCNDISKKICVQGSCRLYGCDLIIDSTARNDACGICNGDNSTCNHLSGVFINQVRHNTYHPIITLPAGATSVKISQRKPSFNYLAVRNKYGKYYLNGNRKIESSGTYTIGGTRFNYENTDLVEVLYTEGPILEDIVLEILSNGVNRGVVYEYSLKKPSRPSTLPTPRYHYTWKTKSTPCSQSCAGGTQNVTVHCFRDDDDDDADADDDDREVSALYCDKYTRPASKITSCAETLCPPKWVASDWGKCSRMCAGGKQKRKVRCWQKISSTKDRKVRPRFCKHLAKPSKRRRCNQRDCPPKWHHNHWSSCSTSCGQGFKTRNVFCQQRKVYGIITTSDIFCKELPRPSTRKICHSNVKCPSRINDRYQWLLSSWGKCSATCNRGVRRRHFKCSHSNIDREYRQVANKYCSHILKPRNTVLHENCLLPPCLKLTWSTGPWSQCSVTCGDGIMMRTIQCTDQDGRLASDCSKPKPEERKRCHLSPCFSSSQSDSSCHDKFDWCPLVPIHRICSHSYYGKSCCESCTGNR